MTDQALAPGMDRSKRRLTPVLREPLLHFLVIGALIFGLFAWIAPPAPVRGPEEIRLTPELVGRLEAQFEAVWRRPPTASEQTGLLADFVREEVYYRQALEFGLDRDDAVIRRRLRQKMEFLTAPDAATLAPDEVVLRDYYTAHPEAFTPPARVSFESVFLSDDPETLAPALAALNGGAAPGTVGQGTLLPPSLNDVPESAVDGTFGAGFFAQVAVLMPGTWAGPVTSAFGLHLVRLTATAPATLPPFEAVRDRVEQAWATDETLRVQEERYRALRDRYTVIGPEGTPEPGL